MPFSENLKIGKDDRLKGKIEERWEPGNIFVVLKQFQDINPNCSAALKQWQWQQQQQGQCWNSILFVAFTHLVLLLRHEMTTTTTITTKRTMIIKKSTNLHFVRRVHPSRLALARSSHTGLPSFILHLDRIQQRFLFFLLVNLLTSHLVNLSFCFAYFIQNMKKKNCSPDLKSASESSGVAQPRESEMQIKFFVDFCTKNPWWGLLLKLPIILKNLPNCPILFLLWFGKSRVWLCNRSEIGKTRLDKRKLQTGSFSQKWRPSHFFFGYFWNYSIMHYYLERPELTKVFCLLRNHFQIISSFFHLLLWTSEPAPSLPSSPLVMEKLLVN